LAYKWLILSNTTIGMLLATINSSIILIALDIFRRIDLDPLTPANTNYLLRTTACLLVGWASSGMFPEHCSGRVERQVVLAG